MILALLIPFFAQAIDLKIPDAGAYTFQGSFAVEQVKRYETVYTINESGRHRLEELLQNGYECRNAGIKAFSCSIFESTEGTEKDIRSDILEKMSSKNRLVFDQKTGDPVQIVKGDLNEEWEVPQSVTIDGQSFNSYRYLISQGIHKIFIGRPAQYTFILSEDAKGFDYPLTVSKTESSMIFRRYFSTLNFHREN